MNAAVSLPLFAASALLVVAWFRLRRRGLLLMAIACLLLAGSIGLQWPKPPEIDPDAGQGAWHLARGMRLSAGVLLAIGIWSLVMGRLRPNTGMPSNPLSRSPTVVLTHVALRLIITGFLCMFGFMFSLVVSDEPGAMSEFVSYGSGMAALLAVWIFWPLLDLQRPRAQDTTFSGIH